MAHERSTDVLICGAGAAGLALAIELARRGVTFSLIEKRDTPFEGSRGKGIQPRTQEVFEDLGIIDRLVAIGGPYPPQREYRADGTTVDSPIAELPEPTPSEPYRLPLLVPQFLTEQVMRERLAELGGAVEFGCELVGFEQDADGVTARIASAIGEQRVRARYLIGCDGGRSIVRYALDVPFPGKTLGVRAVVADVAVKGLGRDAWHRFGEGSMERQLGLCPLAGTGLFQLQAPVPLEGEIDLSVRGLDAMIADRSGRKDVRIESVSWASAFTMNARLAEQFRIGRVFLVGDAAHTHPPTGGQGLNTSIQDACNLGWKLAACLAGASDSLLDTYEEERRPNAAAMLGLATKLLDAARRGDVRRGREVHQLDIGYPESSLAIEHLPRSRCVLAGDRAPDARLCGAGGMPRRLFDLFKGTHWTLLGYGVETDLVAPRRHLRIHRIGRESELVDRDGEFESAYGVVRGDWVLVRPDGYIGAIVTSDGKAPMEQYLERIGLRG